MKLSHSFTFAQIISSVTERTKKERGLMLKLDFVDIFMDITLKSS
jgi:hypothetical protein